MTSRIPLPSSNSMCVCPLRTHPLSLSLVTVPNARVCVPARLARTGLRPSPTLAGVIPRCPPPGLEEQEPRGQSSQRGMRFVHTLSLYLLPGLGLGSEREGLGERRVEAGDGEGLGKEGREVELRSPSLFVLAFGSLKGAHAVDEGSGGAALIYQSLWIGVWEGRRRAAKVTEVRLRWSTFLHVRLLADAYARRQHAERSRANRPPEMMHSFGSLQSASRRTTGRAYSGRELR